MSGIHSRHNHFFPCGSPVGIQEIEEEARFTWNVSPYDVRRPKDLTVWD